MGHAVATKLGVTLRARCTGKHFLLMTGRERLQFEPQALEGALRVA
jgi:FdhD protein